ncbi:DASH complex subunit ask1 [Phanerochaete sordida]|uniref:DASH complex subunit ASK1 n=1 Tax=Phanerochaete sordida TaxID=48140 RepID=A0A9P3G7G4_9APHY|nr:DASH complex subunit ask1 [Phanerochaete sordida]
MPPPLKPIEPKAPRWEPAADPSTIAVPGLDTSASVNDQIEQIEQLITIKLQNVDANFSRIQQVMANRILPAVKRYAVGTEPVREAAKFWTTFFEQAAQIRVPTYDEYTPEHTQTEQTESEAAPEQSQREDPEDQTEAQADVTAQSFQHDQTAEEASFFPGQAAGSSTPATSRHRPENDTFLSQDEPPWSKSLESPMARLDRDLRSLTRDEDVSVASSSALHQDSQYDDSQDVTQRQIPQLAPEDRSQRSRRDISVMQAEKGKGRAKEPLLRDVLKRNIDSSANITRTATSPLKTKSRTPILKAMNPYLPPDSKPADWKGVVDLKDPTVATPRGKTPGRTRFAMPSATKRSTTPGPDPNLDLDDDLDATINMSPPVTMAFAQLPGKGAAPKLGRTPRKQAAESIMKKLLDVEKRLGAPGGSGAHPPASGYSTAKYGAAPGTRETSLLSVPTPPSLNRYSRNPYPPASEISSSLADASLESMMRRVGLQGFDYQPSAKKGGDISSVSSALPSVPSGNAYARPSLSHTAYSSASASVQEGATPRAPVYHFDRRLVDDELVHPDEDTSSDSLDYEDGPGENPTDQFFGAPPYARAPDDDDDSFSSGESDDDDDDGPGPGVQYAPAPAHDMGEDDDDFDDSFDDAAYGQESTEEETLFGVPPAQRLAQQAQRAAQDGVRMMGQELLEDTIGMGAQMARRGYEQETPTPWGR